MVPEVKRLEDKSDSEGLTEPLDEGKESPDLDEDEECELVREGNKLLFRCRRK